MSKPSIDHVRPDELTLLLDGVFRVERAVMRIGNQRLMPWRMTLSTYAAMRIIETQPSLSLTQLSRRAYVRPQTMTRIVSNLQQRGFVERTTHPDSDRTMALTLTDDGVAALREMDAEVLKIDDTFDRALNGDERAELTRMLRAAAAMIESDLREFEG
ncbi:MarR family winged helix-turn-helix transcriptional regulator [Nocardioides luteus]|uniref:MarR family winged helix-turn-helix transcriptional regulator n=1 Tax=Nocardioides luteus TaxID=1844 RepID=UPI0018C8F63F|nr:MarR family transcriptional regulator [Nocardioides luteus]MBG6099058.1 DNA-binding MarR family transcriptional regulator [Nocardioides luteus]